MGDSSGEVPYIALEDRESGNVNVTLSGGAQDESLPEVSPFLELTIVGDGDGDGDDARKMASSGESPDDASYLPLETPSILFNKTTPPRLSGKPATPDVSVDIDPGNADEEDEATPVIEGSVRSVKSKTSPVRPIAQVSGSKPGKFPVTTVIVLAEMILLIAEFGLANFEVEDPRINFFIGPLNGLKILIGLGAKYGPVMRPIDATWTNWLLQSHRFFTAAFLHIGILHFFMNASIQLTIGRKVEMAHGTSRFIVISLISAIGGNLGSAVFTPNLVECGSSGMVFGYFGALVSDYFKNYRRIVKPKKVLLILIVTLVLCFGVGLLPWIDNFAHLGGFVSGFLISVAVLQTGEVPPTGSLNARVTSLRSPLLSEDRSQKQESVTTPSTGEIDIDVKIEGEVGVDSLDDDDTGANEKDPNSNRDRNDKLKDQGRYRDRDRRHLSSILWRSRFLRRFRRSIAICLLLIIWVFGFLVFYWWEDPLADSCNWCRYISCLPVLEWCKMQ